MTCYRQVFRPYRRDIPVSPFFPSLTSRLELSLQLLGKLKDQAELRARVGHLHVQRQQRASCAPFLQKRSAAGSQLGPSSACDACQCLERRLLAIIGWAGGSPGCRVLE